jgi:hypothetical protein
MGEQVYDWRAEGDFPDSLSHIVEVQPSAPYPRAKLLKLGMAVTALALLVSPKGHPEHRLSPRQQYLQAATLEGPETTIQELDGENFGTGISCNFRATDKKDQIAYDTRPGASTTEQHPLKYLLVANGKDNRFDATIEPNIAEFFRVLVRAKEGKVGIHAFDMFDYDHKYDEYHSVKLKSGHSYFGSYGFEKYAVTRKGDEFYMTYSCDDGYMQRWVWGQNDFAKQTPLSYLFDPARTPAEIEQIIVIDEEYGTGNDMGQQ